VGLKEFKSPKKWVAGCDEAGRGCLAGPVYAAAVILPKGFKHPLLDDSKKMRQKDRDLLSAFVKENAIAYAIAMCDHQEIDRINILNASFLAMHRAVESLAVKPGLLLIDGNRFNPYPDIPHQCVVGGDGIYTSIAAASVLAKTERDAHMMRLHELYPQYGWDKNKAYATLSHRNALLEHGYSPVHRRSFRLDYQTKLEL
jgi:ribonuclease HII